MFRAALSNLGKMILGPVWTRFWARIEKRVRPLEVKLDALSEREAEHADTLYRRMYAAELQANHVPILDGQIKRLSQRVAALEGAWRLPDSSSSDAATLSDLSPSARKIYSELRAAIGVRTSNN